MIDNRIHPFSAFISPLPIRFYSLFLLLLDFHSDRLSVTLLLFFLSLPGQRASRDHPTGKSQHQGGGWAQKTCECYFIRYQSLLHYLSLLLPPWLKPCMCLAITSRTVSSCTIPITKARWSKPARRKQTDGLLRATMWSTGYQPLQLRRRRSGLNPSSKTFYFFISGYNLDLVDSAFRTCITLLMD